MYNLSYENIPQIEIKYKSGIIKVGQIKNSEQCYKVMKDMFNADTLEYCEESIVMYMNFANKVIAYDKLSRGGMTGTVIDQRIMFASALKIGATGLIMAHNHPSGTLSPSVQDIEITKEIVKGGDILKIKVLDHLIITADGYYSMADHGDM
jgi:DNA repair protein RadC